MKNRTWLILLITIVFSLTYSSCTKIDTTSYLGNWTERSDMGFHRYGAFAFTIGNFGYVGCGYAPDKPKNKMLRDVWVYADTSVNVGSAGWNMVDSFPGQARYRAVAFSVGGKGYVGTGYDQITNTFLSDFWCFDPAAPSKHQWTRISSIPGADSLRYGGIAFGLNGKGYVGCGITSLGQTAKDFYQYDPATDTWKTLVFPGKPRAFGSCFVIDNYAYIVGGYESSLPYDFYKFDGTEFTPLRKIKPISAESYDDDYTDIVRAYAVGCSSNGRGYLIGGSSSNDNATGSVKSVWEYDPGTDLWSRKNPFEGAARTEAIGLSLENGTIMVGTGRNGSSTTAPLSDFWQFYPNAIYNAYY